MRAMILAAGRGERMRPLTDHTPKPLLHVGGKPLIVWHIENLHAAGFRDIVINTAWLGEQLPATLGNGEQFGVRLHYSAEQTALETAGGIVQALPMLSPDNQPFLVLNGDVWSDYAIQPDYNPFAANTNPSQLAHLVLVNNPEHHPEGDFVLDKSTQRVHTQAENAAAPTLTFSGIGYYRPELFAGLTVTKQPLAPLLRSAMQMQQVGGEHHTGQWYDIGTPERLAALNTQLENRS